LCGELGRRVVVVAEGVRDDRGGHLLDVLADCGDATGSGGDTDLVEQFGKACCGAAPRKMPAGPRAGDGRLVVLVAVGKGAWSGVNLNKRKPGASRE